MHIFIQGCSEVISLLFCFGDAFGNELLLLLLLDLKVLVTAIKREHLLVPLLALFQCFLTWLLFEINQRSCLVRNCMATFLTMLNLSGTACCSLDRLFSPTRFDVFSRDEESKRNNLLLGFLIIAGLAAISGQHCTKTVPFNRRKEFHCSLKVFTSLLFACHSSHTN